MHYHSNHMYCRKSNWGDKPYDCKHYVNIDMYDEYPEENVDWKTIGYIKEEPTEDGLVDEVPYLKDEVLDWLNNLPDLKRDYFKNGTLAAWCIPNKESRILSSVEFAIFFGRRKDAMAFIKKFSVYKKPTSYCNYFKGDWRTLVDGKLVKDMD